MRGPVEAIEDPGEVLAWNAGPMVRNHDLSATDADVDPASRGAPLGGVAQQVVDRATELTCSASHESWGPVDPEGRRRRITGGPPNGIGDDVVEPDVVKVVLTFGIPRQAHDVVNNCAQIRDLGPNILDELTPHSWVNVHLVAQNV
jgi:hypothetical protein